MEKIKTSDLRSTRQVKELDIKEYLKPEIKEKIKGSVIIKIRTLTTAERDANTGYLMRHTTIDRKTKETSFKDESWVHDSRIQLILLAVIKDDPDFPFERWDKKELEEIDNNCPHLLEYISDEIEELNRPLLQKNGKNSDM